MLSPALGSFHQPFRHTLAGMQSLIGLAVPHHGEARAIHQNLGRQGACVVGGRHGGAVSPGIEQGDQGAGWQIGQSAVTSEAIAAFADGANHISRRQRRDQSGWRDR